MPQVRVRFWTLTWVTAELVTTMSHNDIGADVHQIL